MPFGIGTAGYVTRLRKRNTHTLQGVQGVLIIGPLWTIIGTARPYLAVPDATPLINRCHDFAMENVFKMCVELICSSQGFVNLFLCWNWSNLLSVVYAPSSVKFITFKLLTTYQTNENSQNTFCLFIRFCINAFIVNMNILKHNWLVKILCH